MSAQTSVYPQTGSTSLLYRALLVDGVGTGVSGVLLLFTANPIARWMGLDAPVALAEIGLLWAVYGALITAALARGVSARRVGWSAVTLNTLWVFGSVLLLLAGVLPLADTGKWAVLGIALVVADFALVQVYALLRNK